MRVQLSQAILAVAISSAWGLGSAWGQAQQPSQPQQTEQKKPAWKDRAEYDLVQQIDKEKEAKKKIELLNQWQEKYPASDFKLLRLLTFMTTYHQLGDAPKMLETAQEVLKEDPKNIQALYWTNLLIVSMNDTSPAKLDLGDKAGNTILGSAGELFAADKKPANASDADWTKARNDTEAVAHRTLGWVAMARKNFTEAEKHLTEDLKLNPNDGEASYWLGTSILAEKRPEKQSDALYYIARAAAYDGPGGLDPAYRKKIHDYLQKAYATYHGQDPQGFQQLLQTAKAQSLPPQGFKIPSEAEIAADRDKQLQATNPGLALWLRLKDALTAQDGASYFDSNMKGALVPPEGQPAFRATVISQEGARAAKTVTVGVANASTADARLVFETPLPGHAEPGTVIEFRGVASSFAGAPFTVTFDTEKKYVTGWPTPPPPAKKAPIRKRKKQE